MVDHTYEWVEFNVEECVFFLNQYPMVRDCGIGLLNMNICTIYRDPFNNTFNYIKCFFCYLVYRLITAIIIPLLN